MVNYRKFCNIDPPRFMEAWNDIFTSRGSIPLPSVTPFDRFVLSKPYFDPAGLILAFENGFCVGFVHAGLSCGEPTRGVTSIIGVRPAYRRRGIGAELLRQAEDYLKQRGAQVLCAGEQGAANPFYLGLYGGSDSPGVLKSDVDALPFLTRYGYQVDRQILVLQRDLSKPLKIADARFPAIRQRYDVHPRAPHGLGSFAQECDLGQVEPIEFFLEEKKTGAEAAHTFAWEMEGFSWRWRRAAVGLVGFQVEPALRRQGLGKFLLVTLLRQLEEQYCEIVEVQIAEANQEGKRILTDIGFQQVDTGQVFVRHL